MVNLLPLSARRTLVRDYCFRLAAFVLFLMALVTFFGTLLLAPSFFLARATADAGTRYRVALEETVGLRERSGAAASVAALAERIRILGTLAALPVTSDVVDKVTGAMPHGVTLTSLTIVRTDSGAALTLSGSAATRDTLLSLAASLKEVNGFSGVSLPVSSLASDKDIPFAIDITYATPTP